METLIRDANTLRKLSAAKRYVLQTIAYCRQSLVIATRWSDKSRKNTALVQIRHYSQAMTLARNPMTPCLHVTV